MNGTEHRGRAAGKPGGSSNRRRVRWPTTAALGALLLLVATSGCSTPQSDRAVSVASTSAATESSATPSDSSTPVQSTTGSVAAQELSSEAGGALTAQQASGVASVQPQTAGTASPPESGAPLAVEPAPAAAPAAVPMAGSPPVRLQIPALGVDSGLLDLGLNDDGTLQVPPDASSVGWFTGGPAPGEVGPAVIVGHVDWSGELGLFYYLKDMNIGDEITVTRADGSVAQFRVTAREETPKEEFPTNAVYGNIDHAGLRLITCGGEFDRQARSYVDNIIVYADLV